MNRLRVTKNRQVERLKIQSPHHELRVAISMHHIFRQLSGDFPKRFLVKLNFGRPGILPEIFSLLGAGNWQHSIPLGKDPGKRQWGGLAV